LFDRETELTTTIDLTNEQIAKIIYSLGMVFFDLKTDIEGKL